MSIHTIECRQEITKTKFDHLQAILKELAPSKWSRINNCGMISEGLKSHGILIKFLKFTSSDAKKYYLHYQLSPRRLLEPDNYLDLFNSKNFKNYSTLFNSLLKKIAVDFPSIEETNIARADFCFNYQAGTANDAKRYLQIIQRGVVPKNFTLSGSYDPVGKRWKPYRDSFYLKSPGINLSFYNKHAEMTAQKKGAYPKQEIDRSKGIIRNEIQIFGDKMRSLSQKYGFSNTGEFFEVAKAIEDDLFFEYLPKIMGRGELLTLFEAKQSIIRSSLKTGQQEIMEELVEKANLYRNAKLAIEELKLKYGEKKIKKALENFDSIGVSFVTMPHRAAQQFDWFYQPFQAYLISDRT